MNEQLKQFTLDQLKVMVYDRSTAVQTLQTELKILNDEIGARQRAEAKPQVKQAKAVELVEAEEVA
jgi:hypothetical protein